MTLEQLDQLISDWKQKVNLVGQNLIDLHGQPTYQRLAGQYPYPSAQLTGVTQSLVMPAIEAMNELFQHLDLLNQTIERACQLRKQLPRFLASDQKIQEIAQILTTPSIQLSVIATPLAQRSLLSAAESTEAIAPEKLLMVMTNAFQVAKNAILAVDAAWLNLEPSLTAAEAEIIALEIDAEKLNQGTLPELIGAKQAIASLRSSLDCDPLGVSANFDQEIKPLLTKTRTTLQQIINQKRQIQDKIASAHNYLNTLTQLQATNTNTYAESQIKVTNHSSLQTPLDGEQIAALSLWLSRLETKFNEGLLNPVSIGLENWLTKVKQYIATEQQAYAANLAPLETRQELRGRLDALKAKALARGVVEDAILVELAQTAKRLLYTRPTNLSQANQLISQYEKRLNS
jgi:hypothetical protein